MGREFRLTAGAAGLILCLLLATWWLSVRASDVPYRESYKSRTLRHVMTEVAVDLETARQAASREGNPYRFVIRAGTYEIHDDDNADGKIDDTEMVVKRRFPGMISVEPRTAETVLLGERVASDLRLAFRVGTEERGLALTRAGSLMVH